MSRKRERILREAIVSRDEDQAGDLEHMTQLSTDLQEALDEVDRLSKMLLLAANLYLAYGAEQGFYASADTFIAMLKNKVDRDAT